MYRRRTTDSQPQRCSKCGDELDIQFALFNELSSLNKLGDSVAHVLVCSRCDLAPVVEARDQEQDGGEV